LNSIIARLFKEKMTQDFITYKLMPIIRAALGVASVPPLLSEDDYDSLLHFGIQQSILPIMWKGLKELKLTDHLSQFELPRLKDTRDYIIRNNAYNHISAALDNRGISYVPLKGSVIKDLYPEPWMRTSSDIDILVHENDLPSAISAIESSTDFVAGKRGFHDVSMQNSSVHLELHFSIKEGIDSIDQMLEKAWIYVRNTESGNVFTPEFQIFHILAHMSYHLKKTGLGIRPFLDLWLLKERTVFSENEFRDMCDKSGLLTFYEKSCELLDSWMKAKEYTPEAKALEQFCLMGGVFGNAEIASAAALRQNMGVKYFFNRLFIRKSLLEEIYPELRNKPYLLLFFQMKRWLKLLDGDKRKKVIDELKGVRSIGKEQIDSFDKLLLSLGF